MRSPITIKSSLITAVEAIIATAITPNVIPKMMVLFNMVPPYAFVVFVHFSFPSPPKLTDGPLPSQHELSQHGSLVRATFSWLSLTFSFVFCELVIAICLLRELFKVAREAR